MGIEFNFKCCVDPRKYKEKLKIVVNFRLIYKFKA